MKRLTIVALGAVALSGCAGNRVAPAAVCDGKHRRPANLYGTILPSLPVPLPASQQGGGLSMVVPQQGAAARVPTPSSASDAGNTPPTPTEPGATAQPRLSPRLSQWDRRLSYSSC